MRLYFIRHAQSENNALYNRTGSNRGRSIDPELSAIGRQQAELLAECLRSDPQEYLFTHLYCSVMLRSVATGVQVARALGLPLVAWPDIHEEGGIYLENEVTGELEGQPGNNLSFFTTHFPELVLPENTDEGGWWNRPPETRQEGMERVHRFLQELLSRHGDTHDAVAVISHGGFYNLFMAELLRIPSREGLWFFMNNTGITRIDFDDGMLVVVYQNRVCELPAELLT